MKHRLFRKADLVLVILIIVPVLIYFYLSYRNTGKLVAEISVDGKVVETVDLSKADERRVYTPDTSPKVVIVAENGSIFFENSECEDKICVSAGKLNKKGDTAICLPARTVISVVGSDVDAVTY